jgi:Mg-chelatase subunit ChlD
MRPSRAVWQGIAASAASVLLAAACGSSEGSNGDASNGAGGSKTGRGGAMGTAAAGPDLDLGGASPGADDEPGDVGEECAGDLIEAERVPLDMYVMLDVSGSMLAPTEGDVTITKWQAVSRALSDFVSDDGSAGIGVGLQVFPIRRDEAATSCSSDEECGSFGPCANRGCWPLQDGMLYSCLDDQHCSILQSCVVIGECANDATYVCNAETTTNCGGGFGACAVPPSVCFAAGDCRPATYATPLAEIAELPAAAPALLDVINAAMPDPDGLTPTGPALAGAIEQASAWATAHPDHRVVAVLATDGMPTLEAQDMLCQPITSPEQLAAVSQIAAAGRAGQPPVSTFVIGVIGSDDTSAPATLDAIASEGGTERAFIVDTQGDVASQFRDALNQIRASGLSCDLLVPQADAGKTVDYDLVNVVFDDGSGQAELSYVAESASCDDTTGGWYFDKDPDAGDIPEHILVCPATCAKFGAADRGSVQIKLGCERREPVK